ncbi:MAG: hypothetical protein LIO85_07215 [Rikenellaceae bacterium]|nr:hypothetical protein [Rikenellaceae bacterium]
MTLYLTELLDQIERQHERLTPRQLAETLIGLGVIDNTLCKVLMVRYEVVRHIGAGLRKTDAMWLATEKYCCSYEYVRKCIYYYTDLNIPWAMSESV